MSAGDVLPATFTAEELRSAALLVGSAPPPVLGTPWAAEELGVADAVAARVLLARGLAEVSDGPDVSLRPEARSALNPLFTPDTLVEIRDDRTPHGTRRHLVLESGDGRLLAAEDLPSVWTVAVVTDPLDMIICSLLEPLFPDECSARDGSIVVPGQVLSRADELLALGQAEQLSKSLAADNLRESEAAVLSEVLAAAHSLVTVRIARNGTAEHLDAHSLTWLNAGAAGLWLVAPADLDAYALTSADTATLRTALDTMLGNLP